MNFRRRKTKKRVNEALVTFIIYFMIEFYDDKAMKIFGVKLNSQVEQDFGFRWKTKRKKQANASSKRKLRETSVCADCRWLIVVI